MAQAQKKAPYSLVIVESPAKVKTIEKFLGSGYKVTASNGHLIDLPKSKIGIDIEDNFRPEYIVIRGRSKILAGLKEMADKAETVYLATDPDREGEAISWHIATELEKKHIAPDKFCRIEFNEITKKAVTHAIENPRGIDTNRVNAQQARRILDRLVGYKLSPLLWTKVRRGLSAGRVQSVAVKLIVDRENEIRAFVPKEYWTIGARLTDKASSCQFDAKFYGKGGEKQELENEEQCNAVLDAVKNAEFTVTKVKTGTKQKRAMPPFITSTLQQEASKKLGFTTKRTMMVAQGLYEGVSVSESDTVGLITYMRTDSTRISTDAQDAARELIAKKYGKEYIPEKPNVFTSKKNAQDAHEAIRPTYLEYTPDKIKSKLNADQYKLYQLIYMRFLASQMTPAVYDTLSADIDAAGYTFHSSFTKLAFSGCRAVYKDSPEDEEAVSLNMPSLTEGSKCLVNSITPKQNFTAPPTRFTEASLVKTLEELGIGRPSTYSPIISTILTRTYVERSQKNLVPTELGEIVNKLMNDNFKDIVDVQFTADMEDKLDAIETKDTDWHKILSDFYGPFEANLKEAEKNVPHVKIPDRPAGITCELCGAEMVYKTGRFGEFIACPNYPTCKNTKPVIKPISTPCPVCGGQLIQKKSKKGSTFFGCGNYPECTFMSWDMPLEEKCPVCGAFMVLKRSKNGNYKRCSNAECTTNIPKKSKKEDEAK